MQLSLRTLTWSAVLFAGAMQLAESQLQRHTTSLPVSCADYSETLQVRVTYNEQASNEGARPLIVFFPGFQCPSAWYDSYAEDLATKGSYIVLQYDTPRVILGFFKPDNTLLPDGIEVQFVPKLVSWIANEAANKSSPLFGRVDTSRLGLLGHSRGGKLATLALASDLSQPDCPATTTTTTTTTSNSNSGEAACKGTPDQQQQCSAGGVTDARGERPQLAAVLVDPVDSGSGKLGQSGSNRPSAVATLEGKGRSAAIIAAGINTWCNPINSTWSTFWPKLRSGWLQVVSKAGHMQFTGAQGFWKKAFDTVCSAGDIPHAEAREFVTRGALAWFGQEFDGKSASAYIDWSKEQQHQGQALFEIRGGEAYEQVASA